MPLYLDSDVVVKRYVDEGDGATATMDAIFSAPRSWGGLSSSEWLLPEVTAALSKKFRTGQFTHPQFARLVATFRREVNGIVAFVPMEEGDGDAASRLVIEHASSRFHPGDALHVHTAESLRRRMRRPQPVVFVTSDAGLTSVLLQRGLPTFDPASQTLADLTAALRN